MRRNSSIFTFLIIFLAGVYPAFAQEQNVAVNEENRAAFEQALKNYESQKQREQAALTKRLQINLNIKIDAWLENAKREKDSLTGKRLAQNWEKLALYFPISPSHYEYTLLDFKYSIAKNDVTKAESLSSPYKADVVINEDLYVEKSHSPDISDRLPYFYTVTTSYTLHFTSRHEEFELVNTDKRITNIANKVPDEVIRKAF